MTSVYLLTFVYRSAAHIDTMRCFDTLDEAYKYWKKLRQKHALKYSSWWEHKPRGCRAWLISANEPPKLVNKLLEQMVARDYKS